MKTEILDTIEIIPEDLIIFGILVLDNENIVILKGSHSLELNPILQVEVRGTKPKLMDVSHLHRANTSLGNRTIFTYKNGFGIIDHNNDNLHLWDDINTRPIIVNVQQRPSENKLHLDNKYLSYASYDTTSEVFTIGLRPNNVPVDYASWFTELALETSNGDTINAYWDNPYGLRRDDYPQTYTDKIGSTLESLNINDLITYNNKTFIVCRGGRHTIGRSGVAFEFNVLAVYDHQNKLLKKLEMEIGYGRFSTDKNYFILKPKGKKRILVYNLETLEIVYNIPIKAGYNVAVMPEYSDFQVDLKDDILYILNFNTLTVCKILN